MRPQVTTGFADKQSRCRSQELDRSEGLTRPHLVPREEFCFVIIYGIPQHPLFTKEIPLINSLLCSQRLLLYALPARLTLQFHYMTLLV